LCPSFIQFGALKLKNQVLEESDVFWEEKSAPETSYQILSGPPGLCPLGSFSPTFVHGFGHILLIGCPINPIIFRYVHNFKGIISTLLVGVFITFLQCFVFGD
jgi:hypothetical protein